MAEKEIRLPKWDGKEYYPATTTEAVADRERQKGLNEVLSDIESTIDSYNRANQIMLNQKQDKLHYYTENTSTDTAVIKVSHDTDEATFHEDKVEVGVDNCVLLKSEDLLLGEDSYIKVSPEKVSMSSPQGKIDDAVGALVSNANAIAALNGTGEGSVSKKVTDEIAKVIANAPADFDTLKEIADYIDSDKTNAAEINNTLNRHTSEITSLQNNKQDALANYKEESSGKTTIKQPNGTARVEVSKVRAALWANDNKAAIAADANGTRMLYQKTAEDGSIEHRDEISIGRHDDSSATHITLTSKSTNEVDGEKVTQTSSMQVTPEGISMSSPNGEIEDVVKEINEKAPKVGYAPDLKVNFAKELVGRGEATSEVIGGIRPTGVRSIGDGNATIERIKGESVVWNQHVNMGADNTAYGLTFSAYGLGGVRISGTPTQQASDVRITWKKKPATVGHKILAKSNTQKISIRCQGSNVYNGISTATDTTLLDLVVSFNFPTDTAVDLVFYPEIVDLTQMFGAGNEPTTIEDFEARKPHGITNEYNEGTIVSYNGSALKSVGFNAWDEEWEVGKINPRNGANEESTAFKRSANYTKLVKNTNYRCSFTNGISDSVWIMFFDLNGNPIEHKVGSAQVNNLSNVKNTSFVTPNQDCKVRFYVKNDPDSQVCIHLAHTYNPEKYPNGYAPYEADTHPLPNVKSILDANGNQLFPYGLLSAGSVHDEITATKAIKRVGVVDMGTLAWYLNPQGPRFIAPILSMKSIKDWNKIGFLNATKYKIGAVGGPDLEGNIGMLLTNVYVQDNSYTSMTLFKQAMSGVLLYYELAEPIEVDLPEPLNMTYEAWDFGTEELVYDTPTTPLNADIVYQFNAVDRIRENSTNILNKQDTLVSGTNIKTINGQTILGSGDITIQGGGGDLTEVNQRLYNLESQALVTEDSLSPEVVTDYSLMSGDIVQTSGTSENKIMSQKAVTEYIEALRKLAISPSGDPMHNLYISAGAEYNATGANITKTVPWGESVTHKAGYWYLNGIGDLTNEDMCNIYNLKDALTMIVIAGDRGARLLQPCPVKTLYGIPGGRLLDNKRLNGGGAPFISGDIIEVLRWTNNSNKENTYTTVFTLASTAIVFGCANLHTIERTKIAVDSIIQRCPALRHWHIHGLNISMNMLSGCPNFSAESIHYIIQNAIGGTASAPITITLHSTAKANWEASAYYTEDLTKANELNITIA